MPIRVSLDLSQAKKSIADIRKDIAGLNRSVGVSAQSAAGGRINPASGGFNNGYNRGVQAAAVTDSAADELASGGFFNTLTSLKDSLTRKNKSLYAKDVSNAPLSADFQSAKRLPSSSVYSDQLNESKSVQKLTVDRAEFRNVSGVKGAFSPHVSGSPGSGGGGGSSASGGAEGVSKLGQTVAPGAGGTLGVAAGVALSTIAMAGAFALKTISSLGEKYDSAMMSQKDSIGVLGTYSGGGSD